METKNIKGELFFSENKNDIPVSIRGGATINATSGRHLKEQKRQHHVEIEEPLYWDTEPDGDVGAKRLAGSWLEKVGWKVEL